MGTSELADAAVTRAKLAPGAIVGNATSQAITSFTTAVIGTWVPVQSLLITTRGANPVLLFTNHMLWAGSGGAPGTIVVRWMRNPGGVHLCNTAYTPNGANNTFPVPSLPWCDLVPDAAYFGYEFQVFLGVGASTVQYTAAGSNGNIAAFEIG